MKLLQLKSDNPKFKTLDFNPNLNIIAGLQLSDEDKKTFNGIGKSLSLTLIHLIFGSKLDVKKSKEKKLKNYLKNYGTFYLTFKHNNIDYEISKNFSRPEFYINNRKINAKDYPQELNDIFSSKNLRFRWIFNTFARRFGGDYYSDALRQQGQSLVDYYQRFVNLKLLGIDTALVEEQFDVKEKLLKLDKAEKVIEEYRQILDQTNLKDLKDEYENLQKDKKSFKIAPNYDELKKKADDVTEQLNITRNSIHKLRNLLQLKKNNLNLTKNIVVDNQEIENLFNEIEFYFTNEIKKRLEDAQNFHIKLIENRKKRIKSEIDKITAEVDSLQNTSSELSIERDSLFKLLDSSGALEEYNSIVSRISYLNNEIQKLTKYEATLSDFKKERSRLNLESAKIKASSLLYLDENKDYLEFIEDKFRDIVKKFYDNQGGSLKITETKNAKYLYNIEIETPRSGSQAIGNAEIFCYDILLYQLNPEILNFLAHDGYIFSEMDPRQKAMIFKVILELIEKNDLQYFINIGENSLNEVLNQNILTSIDKKTITESVILELFDKNPENWLMGEEFN